MAKRKDTKDLEQDAERTDLEGSDEGDSSEGAELANRGADSDGDDSAGGETSSDDPVGEGAEDQPEASELGTARYVHAAFFGAGILAAYVCGKLLLTAWNMLADWPDAVRQVPTLLQYGEDERASFTMVAGALVGIALVVWYYRKESVRNWAGEVASELSRVTWPNKETVTNGTMVVLVATLVATVYVAILDRFWGYLTNLVYGA
jgi:preprotein translocase subunit SecE